MSTAVSADDVDVTIAVDGDLTTMSMTSIMRQIEDALYRATALPAEMLADQPGSSYALGVSLRELRQRQADALGSVFGSIPLPPSIIAALDTQTDQRNRERLRELHEQQDAADREMRLAKRERCYEPSPQLPAREALALLAISRDADGSVDDANVDGPWGVELRPGSRGDSLRRDVGCDFDYVGMYRSMTSTVAQRWGRRWTQTPKTRKCVDGDFSMRRIAWNAWRLEGWRDGPAAEGRRAAAESEARRLGLVYGVDDIAAGIREFTAALGDVDWQSTTLGEPQPIDVELPYSPIDVETQY